MAAVPFDPFDLAPSGSWSSESDATVRQGNVRTCVCASLSWIGVLDCLKTVSHAQFPCEAYYTSIVFLTALI